MKENTVFLYNVFIIVIYYKELSFRYWTSQIGTSPVGVDVPKYGTLACIMVAIRGSEREERKKRRGKKETEFRRRRSMASEQQHDEPRTQTVEGLYNPKMPYSL